MLFRKINILPNAITAFGLACGLFVIFKVNMTGFGTYELLHTTTLILLLAGVADLLDGAVARAIRAESEFGVLFDSLADAISFGVAPSVLLLKSLGLEQRTVLSFLAVSAAMLYTLCGVLRLVRFNVHAGTPKSASEKLKDQKNFVGLPIPAAAAAAIAPNLLVNSPLFQEWFTLSQRGEAIMLSLMMILIGYLMMSKWRFPSLKTVHCKVDSFPLVFFAALAAISILYGLFHYLPILLMVIAWGYILLGFCLTLARLIIGKKSKALLDFDPLIEEFQESKVDEEK